MAIIRLIIHCTKESTIKAFEKLNLHPDILKAVAAAQYENATAIQNKVIPVALKGSDVLGASKSGTGKTAAYVLTTTQQTPKSSKKRQKVIRALIIVPTIELVDQVSRSINDFGKYLDINNVKIQGGSLKVLNLSVLKKVPILSWQLRDDYSL